jgi:hypothetical protein
MGAFGHATYSSMTGSMWFHISRQPALACHGGTKSHQGQWCDPVQYHVTMIGVTKRIRTGNKVFAGSFLEYDF